jgi:NAD(P)-dependent dehydrogenase (short-subunit alcohol dehydrogenase family)
MENPEYPVDRAPSPDARNVNWNFEGSVVVVTGAARGQGRAHALGFAAAGATVAICDIPTPIPSVTYKMGTPEQLESVAEEIRGHGGQALAVPADVRNEEEVTAFLDRVLAEFGQIDILVNNAGIASLYEIVDMPTEIWDDMLNTNLKGVFLCAKHAGKQMVKAGRGGKIVSTSSVFAWMSTLRQAHYSASKHGVAGLTKGLAIELAPHGINVNAVAPTVVNTSVLNAMAGASVPEDFFDQINALNGTWNLFDDDGLINPTDVTQAVMFLASDAARSITGTILPVDCGFLAT